MQKDPRQRVLVVDDEPRALQTIASALSFDYEVSCAASGEDALSIVAAGMPKVICTDLQLGGINGLQLLREARRLDPTVQGILVSGYREYLESLRDEARDFMVLFKPYPTEKLLGMIELALRVGDMLREPPGGEP